MGHGRVGAQSTNAQARSKGEGRGQEVCAVCFWAAEHGHGRGSAAQVG